MNEEKNENLFTPSPAQYNIQDLSNKTPFWSISKAKREFSKVNNDTPGSGKYECKAFIGEGPKYTMRPKYSIDGITEGKRLPKAPKKKDIPGPGHYNPLDKTFSQSFTIGVKREPKKSRKVNEEPGVGSYNLIDPDSFKVPSYTISKEKRDNLDINYSIKDFPAPNKYKYNSDGMSSLAPKWTFNKAERIIKRSKIKSSLLRRNYSVGPGSYSTQYFIGNSGPTYSFPKVKYNHADVIDVYMEKKTINYPAPTTYNKNIKYVPDTPFISISRCKKTNFIDEKSNVPGPGSYNPNKYLLSVMKQVPVWSIYNSERDKSIRGYKYGKRNRMKTPGPGHYNVKNGNIPNGPTYTIGQRLKRSKSMLVPGPGAYDLLKIQDHPSEPKYSFGKEKRKSEIEEQIKVNFPGPCKYDIKVNNFTKGMSFNKEKRMKNNKVITPGPGQYKIPTSFNSLSEYARARGLFESAFRYV